MSKLCETLHTEDALTTELSELVAISPDLRVVGSMGRSVVYRSLYGTPNHEFALRDQPVVGTPNRPRDIDIVGVSESEVRDLQPFVVDTSGFSSPVLEITPDGGDWFLLADHHNFCEPLHPDVMEPIVGTGACEAEIVTVPAQTHLNLYGLKGNLRKKDKFTVELLKQACDDLVAQNRRPAGMYAPFEKLKELNDHDLLIKMQNLYRACVPEPVRVKAKPFVRIVKRLVL